MVDRWRPIKSPAVRSDTEDMQRDPRRPATFSLRALYGASVVFGAILSHLLAEALGMGEASDSVAFSPRHIYLGVALLAALGVVAQQILTLLRTAQSGRDAKRLAEIGLRTLPFAGRTRFVIFTAALQFALAWSTEIGEGCPLCGHDVGAGFAGALFGAIVAALFVRLLARRLPTAASAVVRALLPAERPAAVRLRHDQKTPLTSLDAVWSTRLFNRPPPLQPSIIAHH